MTLTLSFAVIAPSVKRKQLIIAEALQKELEMERRRSFISVVTNLQLGLGAGRVAAAKARGKLDKAASALANEERRLEKVGRKLAVLCTHPPSANWVACLV